MPLAFNSLSHGEIAFGFFNIETDLLLLDTYFIFASDFCRHIGSLADGQAGQSSTEWDVYILDHGQIGNLAGAIHGFDLCGFIGEVYKRFPFPKEPEKFKQNPDGWKTREIVKEMIDRYQHPSPIAVAADPLGATLEIGDYMFSRYGFHNLLLYVWQGGYPQWKGGTRPEYVVRMKEKVLSSHHPLFEGAAPFI